MEEVPYFHALATFACKANRLYRIYVCRHELVFIWAGKGGEGMAGARFVSRARAGAVGVEGLLSRALGKGLERWLDPARRNEDRGQQLDRTPLARLIADHPANVRLHIGGFQEVRIGARSDHHARAYSDHGHQALLHIRHRKLGKLRLGLSSVEDVHLAMDHLPRVLGTRVRVDTVRPMREQPCGCRFCRFPR